MTTDRMTDAFNGLKGSGRTALVGFLMAGDPEASEDEIRGILKDGLDVLELGVPFSDPIADGPVIQAAGQRALAAGTTPARVLDLVGRLRKDSSVPIILFGYLNPFLACGFDSFCRDAARAGADGLLIVDLPFEEAADYRKIMKSHGLPLIPLVAPTTPPARARAILEDAEGFVYYIMVKGVTGARERVAADLGSHVAEIRKCTPLPIVAGFGIGNPSQARQVARCADGIVVGSALVEAAREKRLGSFVRELRAALSPGGK